MLSLVNLIESCLEHCMHMSLCEMHCTWLCDLCVYVNISGNLNMIIFPNWWCLCSLMVMMNWEWC